MSAKDNLINVGLLAAGGVAIAAAAGVYSKGSRSKMNAQGLISRLSQIPGVSRAFVSDTWHDGYNRITVVLKTQGTIPVTVEARGAHQNLHQISDYAKTAAAVRAAAKASGLFVEGVVGPKKIYEYVRPQYRRAGDKRESGFDGKEMYVEVYEGKGSMTRDGSYEATLMFDADEDDPARLAQQRLMNSPFAQQARPLTAEPPRITSAQGSAARRAGMAGMSASVEQDSLSGLWSVYLHDGRRIVNVTGDVFTTKSAAEREAKAMLAQAKAGVTIDALGSMFWEKHHKPRGSHSKSGSSSVLRGMTSKAGTPIPGPSLKTLDDRLNLGGEEGKSLRYFMTEGKRQAALDYANELLGGNGIEYIESQQDTMRHREGLSYVNMGDTYDTTLIYDHKTGRFYVGAWGDWVERYPKRFG